MSTLLVSFVGHVEDGFADVMVTNNTVIKSSTSASTDSGGNSAHAGAVSPGKSSASVESHTWVNGQEVESFSKTVESKDGSPASILYKNTVSTSSVDIKVQGSAKVNATGTIKSPSALTLPGFMKSMLGIPGVGTTSGSTTTSVSSTSTVKTVSVLNQWRSFWLRAGALLRTLFIF